MRVIAGTYKGRRLKIPKGVAIRPTSEKVKEALFNILGKEISASSFLELFAGSGSVGIEAKSRGAEEVIFVENKRICIKAIEENLKRLGIVYGYGLKGLAEEKMASVTLLPLDTQRAIEILFQKKQKFDFIFLDPPYAEGILKNCLIKIGRYDILKPRSWVIAEHRQSELLPEQLFGLKLKFTKRYGDTALSFYQKR